MTETAILDNADAPQSHSFLFLFIHGLKIVNMNIKKDHIHDH